jgi:thiol-disulfide isomerase/thioredoxin
MYVQRQRPWNQVSPVARAIQLVFFALFPLIFFAVASAQAPSSSPQEIDGPWDASVVVGPAEVPFNFEISSKNGQIQGFFFEGHKRIGSNSGRFVNNDLQLQYEFLNSTLDATFDGEQLQGTYRYNRKNGKEYAFHASRAHPVRYETAFYPRVPSDWEMKLVGEDQSPTKDSRSALSWKLFLHRDGQEIYGSILRIDGDTGTLTGHWQGRSLVLSHFAGERPVLFEAVLQPDGTLDVTYNRLNKYLAAPVTKARAKGIPEPPDPANFSSVKDASLPFQFQFSDLDGKLVSSTDEQFRGKVVLVNISGTWCPNCRDEAPFLVGLYKQYHARGLEIVSLSFEADGDPVKDKPRIASFINEFAIPYPVLLAGAIGEVPDKLPQLVGFDAYPTTLFLGRDGRVRTIHAGFASSATGEASSALARETSANIERLLAETTTASAP